MTSCNGKLVEFDPEMLKLDQNFTSKVTMERLHFNVEVRKPDRQWHIRVHPDSSMRIATKAIILREEREFYLVDRSLWSQLASELTDVLLVTSINRQGREFLWWLNYTRKAGKMNRWHQSALAAVEIATQYWIRIAADQGEYRIEKAKSLLPLPEPAWSGRELRELLQDACKNRFVDTITHPIVKKLRGEI